MNQAATIRLESTLVLMCVFFLWKSFFNIPQTLFWKTNNDSVTGRRLLLPHSLFLLQSFWVSFRFSPVMPLWLLAQNSWAVIFWQACINTSPSLAFWQLSLMNGVLESTLQEDSTTQIWSPHRSFPRVGCPVFPPSSSAQTSWKQNLSEDVAQWYVSNKKIYSNSTLR